MDNEMILNFTSPDETTQLFDYNLNNQSDVTIKNDDVNETIVIDDVSLNSWIFPFQTFMIAEIAMTVFELALVVTVATKYKRFRRNYRNQMLMQISVVRVLKRLLMYLAFWTDNFHGVGAPAQMTWYQRTLLTFVQIYTDLVTVLLIMFFIKYMYDSLIVVIVKLTAKTFTRILLCAWLIPLPVAAMLTTFEFYLLTSWQLYLLVCCIFKWPLFFVGISTYITVLIKVMAESGRKPLRGLTVTTFLLCITMTLYLLCRDVVELCCHNTMYVILMGILGIVYNVLLLVIYVYLIAESTRRASKNRFEYYYSVEYPAQYKVCSEFSGSNGKS